METLPMKLGDVEMEINVKMRQFEKTFIKLKGSI